LQAEIEVVTMRLYLNDLKVEERNRLAETLPHWGAHLGMELIVVDHREQSDVVILDADRPQYEQHCEPSPAHGRTSKPVVFSVGKAKLYGAREHFHRPLRCFQLATAFQAINAAMGVEQFPSQIR
jgi:hypothetical protein